MAASVTFLGVGRKPAEPDPAAVQAAYEALFSGVLEVDDLAAWYAALTERIAVVEAVLESARQQRAMVVAHMHDSLGQSYAEIVAATKGALSAQRAGQLAAKGRPHIKPLSVKEQQS